MNSIVYVGMDVYKGGVTLGKIFTPAYSTFPIFFSTFRICLTYTINSAHPVNIHEATYTFNSQSNVGSRRKTVPSQIKRKTTVPKMVKIAGSTDLPIPRRAALSTS